MLTAGQVLRCCVREMKRTIRLILTLLVTAALGVIAFALFSGRTLLPTLPNPNGYDDLVRAGNLITASTNSPHEMDLETLTQFIADNAESLRLARVGLSRTCSVPTAEVLTNFGARMSDLAATKSLALLLAGEGRLAALQGRTNDALRCYVDVIRLGNEASRGGFVIHRLSGIACEAVGYVPLSKMATGLDCEQVRWLMHELETVDQSRVTMEEVMVRERQFVRHEMFKSKNPILWVTGWWQARDSLKKWRLRDANIIARLRLLTVELALRCQVSGQGRVPARLDELVPNQLARVPVDPFGSQPLHYVPSGTNWLLYSVGPDGVDDGGKPSAKTIPPRRHSR